MGEVMAAAPWVNQVEAWEVVLWVGHPEAWEAVPWVDQVEARCKDIKVTIDWLGPAKT